MRELGVYSSGGGREHTKLRNQMERLFNAHVSLVYEDKRGKATVNSQIADSTVFWWNPQRPDQPSLWESKIELSEKFFNEIISHPVPLDMNTLKATQALFVGPRSLPLVGLPHLHPSCFATPHLATDVPSVRSTPGQG